MTQVTNHQFTKTTSALDYTLPLAGLTLGVTVLEILAIDYLKYAKDISPALEMAMTHGSWVLLSALLGLWWWHAKVLRKEHLSLSVCTACLHSLANNVLIADNNDNLVYLNQQSGKTLNALSDEIRKTFPGFDTSKLQGASIHQFHKNPEPIRQRLRGMQEGQQHRTYIKLGTLTLSLNVGGIFYNGKRVGSYAEWSDATAQRQMEEKISETASHISNATRDIAAGNLNLSERTEAQAANIEQTTASMQQITSTVVANSQNAQNTLQLADQAQTVANKGGKIVTEAIDAMQKITASSTKIANIIGVIDELAFQTNLLALNAAVEAARAGEQGRGFAVVAGEVRSLAQRSAEASKEIRDLIQASVLTVKEGATQVDQTGHCLKDIIGTVNEVKSRVEEIARASSEQTVSLQEINKAITEMDNFTQQNAALVEQAASASKSLEEQASNLDKLVQGAQQRGHQRS